MEFTIEDYDFRNCFETERILLLITGFYPQKRSANFKYILGILSACFNLLIAIMQLFSMVIQMILDRNNLSKLTELLLFFITHITYLVKLTNFVYNKRNIIELELNLTDSIFYGFSKDRLYLVKLKMLSCFMIAKIFRFLCVVALLLYGLAPYFDKSKAASLPLPGWFPYDTSKYYHETVFFQMLSVASTAYNNSTIDIFTWILITIATAQFDILKENLSCIKYQNKNTNNEIDENTKLYFKNCIRHHSAIVRLARKIESTFSKGIFLQFFASVVVICFTGFQMIVVPIPSVQFGFLTMYFLCMMWQVGMYCWYGHDLMTTSNSIGYSFYMSNWYESNSSMGVYFSIFLEATKKPVVLTAGKFIVLSLTTFSTILRSSYSYFAVLQHLYKKI